MTEPRASISVDLDDLWAYQRTHGDAEWQRLGTYLPIAVPRMLEAFDDAGCKATVFIVGADAARDNGPAVLQPIARHGHELGNHSFGHACWLHRFGTAEIGEELTRAHGAIRDATGLEPVGFRGPGYTWSGTLLEAVADCGYRFDSSILPSFIGPLARRAFLRTAHFTEAERRLRADIFGSFRDGLRPNRPYLWQLPGGRDLLEIPVTTVPLVRVPFHQSYIVYLASYSPGIARGYFRAGLEACRTAGIEPTILFHPLDWLGGDEVPALRFFPGMGLTAATKIGLLKESLRMLSKLFILETMGVTAARLLEGGGLPARCLGEQRSDRLRAPAMAGAAEPWDGLQRQGGSK